MHNAIFRSISFSISQRILLLYFHFILEFRYIQLMLYSTYVLCVYAFGLHIWGMGTHFILFSRYQFHYSDIWNENYEMVSAFKLLTTVDAIYNMRFVCKQVCFHLFVRLFLSFGFSFLFLLFLVLFQSVDSFKFLYRFGVNRNSWYDESF